MADTTLCFYLIKWGLNLNINHNVACKCQGVLLCSCNIMLFMLFFNLNQIIKNPEANLQRPILYYQQ